MPTPQDILSQVKDNKHQLDTEKAKQVQFTDFSDKADKDEKIDWKSLEAALKANVQGKNFNFQDGELLIVHQDSLPEFDFIALIRMRAVHVYRAFVALIAARDQSYRPMSRPSIPEQEIIPGQPPNQEQGLVQEQKTIQEQEAMLKKFFFNNPPSDFNTASDWLNTFTLSLSRSVNELLSLKDIRVARSYLDEMANLVTWSDGRPAQYTLYPEHQVILTEEGEFELTWAQKKEFFLCLFPEGYSVGKDDNFHFKLDDRRPRWFKERNKYTQAYIRTLLGSGLSDVEKQNLQTLINEVPGLLEALNSSDGEPVTNKLSHLWEADTEEEIEAAFEKWGIKDGVNINFTTVAHSTSARTRFLPIISNASFSGFMTLKDQPEDNESPKITFTHSTLTPIQIKDDEERLRCARLIAGQVKSTILPVMIHQYCEYWGFTPASTNIAVVSPNYLTPGVSWLESLINQLKAAWAKLFSPDYNRPYSPEYDEDARSDEDHNRKMHDEKALVWRETLTPEFSKAQGVASIDFDDPSMPVNAFQNLPGMIRSPFSRYAKFVRTHLNNMLGHDAKNTHKMIPDEWMARFQELTQKLAFPESNLPRISKLISELNFKDEMSSKHKRICHALTCLDILLNLDQHKTFANHFFHRRFWGVNKTLMAAGLGEAILSELAIPCMPQCKSSNDRRKAVAITAEAFLSMSVKQLRDLKDGNNADQQPAIGAYEQCLIDFAIHAKRKKCLNSPGCWGIKSFGVWGDAIRTKVKLREDYANFDRIKAYQTTQPVAYGLVVTLWVMVQMILLGAHSDIATGFGWGMFGLSSAYGLSMAWSSEGKLPWTAGLLIYAAIIPNLVLNTVLDLSADQLFLGGLAVALIVGVCAGIWQWSRREQQRYHVEAMRNEVRKDTTSQVHQSLRNGGESLNEAGNYHFTDDVLQKIVSDPGHGKSQVTPTSLRGRRGLGGGKKDNDVLYDAVNNYDPNDTEDPNAGLLRLGK